MDHTKVYYCPACTNGVDEFMPRMVRDGEIYRCPNCIFTLNDDDMKALARYQ